MGTLTHFFFIIIVVYCGILQKNQIKLFKYYDNEVKATKPSVSKSLNFGKMRSFFQANHIITFFIYKHCLMWQIGQIS